MSTSVLEIFRNMPSYFVKGGVDRNMSIYFSIGDGPDGKWTVLLTPENIEIKPGKAVESADLVLKTSEELFSNMVLKGYTPGTMDFLRGKIKSNDPTGLTVLRSAFRFPG